MGKKGKPLGIDIGGSGIKGAPVDLAAGDLAGARLKILTPKPATPDAVAEVVDQIVDHFAEQTGDSPIGVTVPAVVVRGTVLSAANIESYRQNHIAPVLAASLARLDGKATVDLAADYAAIIPARVICSLLGMPTDDDAMVAEILACNDAIVAFIASGYRDTDLRDKALAGSHRLNEMLLPYIRARRDDPADDFISRVWKDAPDFGIQMDEVAALGICRELFFAGSDTTVHGIANALYLVLADPKVMERVRADPEAALPAVVEESLRLMNVVQFRHRFCMEDTEVGDTTVKKGEMIILLHAAANRDPERFACPAEVDLDRPDLTGHLAFARGTRSCVGSSLARTEMQEAVRQIIDRFPHLHLDPSAEPPSFRALYMRSMGPLNVIPGPSA